MTEPAVGSARRRVLLTVSGVVPQGLADAVASGSRPRVDYVEMAKAFEADLVDYAEAARRLGRTGRLIERVLGKNIALAWCCFTLRHSYDVIMTDGEQVGLPYAAFTMVSGRRRARHLMIVHILSVPKKAVLFRLLRLRRVLVGSARLRHRVAADAVTTSDTRSIHGRYRVLRAWLRCRRRSCAAGVLGRAGVP